MIKQAFETSDEELKENEVEYEIQEKSNKEVIDIETGEIQDTKNASAKDNIVSEEITENEGPAF